MFSTAFFVLWAVGILLPILSRIPKRKSRPERVRIRLVIDDSGKIYRVDKRC